MNYELMWAFRLRRRAFRYIFARSPRPRSQIPFPNLVPAWLAKDAAPIPNALAAAKKKRAPVSRSSPYL